MYKTYQLSNCEQANNTLNNILDIINEGVWDWSAKTGHVGRSPGWYRMLGYDVGIFQEDVFTWENVIHPHDYPRVMRHFELYTTGKSDAYSVEYRCKKADGSYLWIRDKGRIVEYDDQGKVARMIGAHE
ncbi:PAS domain-containing protein, partial [Psychromonas sp.]|uniref:PAS domain-containing protein n=1 Tax=Psychromonas sp. TaxID=1884585 RepID=UPI003566CEA0